MQLLNPTRLLVLVLLLAAMMVACESEPPKVAVDDLPDGDAARGAELYNESINGAPSCISCHQLSDAAGAGPGLGGYATIAGDRVDGESAEEYTYNAIIRPAKYLVTGYSNIMYNGYEDALSPQDLADLVAYLLTLE